jgi:hypothetical protein
MHKEHYAAASHGGSTVGLNTPAEDGKGDEKGKGSCSSSGLLKHARHMLSF